MPAYLPHCPLGSHGCSSFPNLNTGLLKGTVRVTLWNHYLQNCRMRCDLQLIPEHTSIPGRCLPNAGPSHSPPFLNSKVATACWEESGTWVSCHWAPAHSHSQSVGELLLSWSCSHLHGNYEQLTVNVWITCVPALTGLFLFIFLNCTPGSQAAESDINFMSNFLRHDQMSSKPPELFYLCKSKMWIV